MIGSANYDAEDDDWGDEDFVPKERCCPHLGIDDTYEWEFVLEKMVIILKELISN